jgi:cytochrome P450
MRFDPLAPAVQRRSSRDAVLAAGTSCETRIPAGSIVLPSFASAMRDPRRVANPERFDPDRPASDYIHFGYGMHHCFGEATNRAMLPAMLQAILTRPIQRAPGADGHLRRRGFFSDALWVTWQPRP